jgi:PleD family two-component response regulator
VEQLFIQADKALLEAKHSGKNRIYLVGESENSAVDIG